MSPTARTLKALRASGYTADVCERWIAQAGVRKDLFGVGDVLAVRPAARDVLLVQASTATNISARVRKAKGRPELAAWLACGCRFEVWGWYQDRAGRWQVRRVELTGQDLQATVLTPTRRRTRRPTQGELFAPAPGGNRPSPV